jgi:hypothetical protein
MDLYGKFTWKIENFSEISKRELRSNVFEVGGMKWCVTNTHNENDAARVREGQSRNRALSTPTTRLTRSIPLSLQRNASRIA